jgi:hypothetical protein
VSEESQVTGPIVQSVGVNVKYHVINRLDKEINLHIKEQKGPVQNTESPKKYN